MDVTSQYRTKSIYTDYVSVEVNAVRPACRRNLGGVNKSAVLMPFFTLAGAVALVSTVPLTMKECVPVRYRVRILLLFFLTRSF